MNKITKILAIVCVVFCLACLVACDQVDENDPTALKPFAAPDPNNPYDIKGQKQDMYVDWDRWADSALGISFTNTESLNNLFHDFTPEDFPGLEVVKVWNILPNKLEKIRGIAQKGNLTDDEKEDLSTFNRHIGVEFSFHSYEKLAEVYDILWQRQEIRYLEPFSQTQWFSEPNDTNYSSQQQNIADLIDLETAWDHTTGSSSVKVGVIDTGIMGTHPDLSGNIGTGLNAAYGYYSNALVDEHGHGTSVAGIIGAVGNNEIGISGICWEISLISLKISGRAGDPGVIEEYGEDPYAFVDAINDIKDDIPILSFSGGWTTNHSVVRDAIATYPGLIVCAAGNSNINLDAENATKVYPACYDLDNILVVGATNDDGSFWASSNYGQTSVDIFAPGVTIYTTANSGSYTTISGTSTATPFVSGVAALLLSYDPTLTTAELKSAIMNGADTVASLSGKCVTGGILNALGAIKQKHQEKIGYDYTNISLGRGHSCTCSDCDHTFERNHTWTPFLDFFKCVYCLALSTIIENIHPLTFSGRYQLLLQQAALAATDSSYYSVDIDEHSSIVYYKGNYFIVAECDENGNLLYDIPDSVLAEGYVIRDNEVVLEDEVPETEIA